MLLSVHFFWVVLTRAVVGFLDCLPRSLPPPLDRMLGPAQNFRPAHNLTYTDKISISVSVETLVPFLDLDLVEFASCNPYQFKLRGREYKWVLKSHGALFA